MFRRMKRDRSDASLVSVGNIKHGGGNAVYSLGMIGALVYYIQQASTFWLFLVALFKGIFWPAFVVYELLKFLAR